MHVDIPDTPVEINQSDGVVLSLLIDRFQKQLVVPVDFLAPNLSWGLPLIHRYDFSVLEVDVVDLGAGVELDVVGDVDEDKHLVEVVALILVPCHHYVVLLAPVVELQLLDAVIMEVLAQLQEFNLFARLDGISVLLFLLLIFFHQQSKARFKQILSALELPTNAHRLGDIHEHSDYCWQFKVVVGDVSMVVEEAQSVLVVVA